MAKTSFFNLIGSHMIKTIIVLILQNYIDGKLYKICGCYVGKILDFKLQSISFVQKYTLLLLNKLTLKTKF